MTARDEKGRFVRAAESTGMPTDTRPAHCQSGQHVFVDGVCADCDALAPFEGRRDLHPDVVPFQPWFAPHEYTRPMRWELRGALLALALGALLLVSGCVIGLSDGVETIGASERPQ